MNVHIVKPYSLIKDLGQAYNEEMRRIPDGHWACLMDYDTMFLTPDCGKILYIYADSFPDTGLFTCYTNRIHPKATDQLIDGVIDENLDLGHHVNKAYNQKAELFKVTELDHEVSGFCMMISKATWNEQKFGEFGRCLGVDNEYCWALFEKGKKIRRMDGLYVLHMYRLRNGIHSKEHLKNV